MPTGFQLRNVARLGTLTPPAIELRDLDGNIARRDPQAIGLYTSALWRLAATELDSDIDPAETERIAAMIGTDKLNDALDEILRHDAAIERNEDGTTTVTLQYPPNDTLKSLTTRAITGRDIYYMPAEPHDEVDDVLERCAILCGVTTGVIDALELSDINAIISESNFLATAG